MTRAFNILFGMRALERSEAAHVVKWALSCLEDGCDSVSLRICAGFDERTNSFESDTYLRQALHELGVTPPSHAEALKRYAEQVAIDVLEKRCSPAFAVENAARELLGLL